MNYLLPPRANTISVLAVGIATKDVTLDIARFPKEDEKIRALRSTTSRGGNASNILEVVAQFSKSGKSILIAPLPRPEEDPDAAFVKESLVRAGVDLSAIAWRTSASGGFPTSMILRNISNQSRTIVHTRDFAELSFAEFQTSFEVLETSGKSLDWIHFEGRAPAETMRMMEYAQSRSLGRNARISLELERKRNLESEELASGNGTTLLRDEDLEVSEKGLLKARPDLVVFSSQWMRQNGFESAESACETLVREGYSPGKQARWIFTQGQQGSVGFEFQDSSSFTCRPVSSFRVPAVSDFGVVDTVGAGDTFIAGLLLALGSQLKFREAVEFATHLAALKISRNGFGGLGNSGHLSGKD